MARSKDKNEDDTELDGAAAEETADAGDTSPSDGSPDSTDTSPPDTESEAAVEEAKPLAADATRPDDGDADADGDQKSDDTRDAEGKSATEPDTAGELAAALGSAALIGQGQEAPEEMVKDAPAAEEVAYDEDHTEDVEEEASRPLASRVLTWLFFLVLGGGLALWGGPQIAPGLPDGLGPVKAWLMPGEMQSQTRIAELEASIDERLGAVSAGLDAGTVETIVAERTAALVEEQAALQAAVADLTAQVEDAGNDEPRIAGLETRLEGLAGQLESLGSLPTGEGLTGEQAAELSAFSSAVEGLKSEFASLAERQGTLSARIDDVEAAIERRLAQAEAEVEAVRTEATATKNVAVARAAMTAIETALATGVPFEESMADLTANTDMAVPAALLDAAATGVATQSALRDGFSDAAHAAIRAEIRAGETEASVGGRLVSYLEAQVASRSLTPQEGDSADAVLSRAEAALGQDNLAEAVRELRTLPEDVQAAMGGWIERADTRAAALSALGELETALTAQN